jgi:GNAT superfamily N-acetyltransferase
MDITIDIEKFEDFYKDAEQLFKNHSAEVSTHEAAGFNFSARYDVYLELDRTGHLVLAVMRQGHVIVGYYIGVIQSSLNYADCLTCGASIFYVAPEIRNQWADIKLFRFVEQELARRKIDLWQIACKFNHNTEAIFKRVGAFPAEITYYKWLGKQNE